MPPTRNTLATNSIITVSTVGLAVGEELGDAVGLGDALGLPEGLVLGERLGDLDGESADDVLLLGLLVVDGNPVGNRDGQLLGNGDVGRALVGRPVGKWVGLLLGHGVGRRVGATVGCMQTSVLPDHPNRAPTLATHFVPSTQCASLSQSPSPSTQRHDFVQKLPDPTSALPWQVVHVGAFVGALLGRPEG
jgi:hypothetical protein